MNSYTLKTCSSYDDDRIQESIVPNKIYRVIFYNGDGESDAFSFLRTNGIIYICVLFLHMANISSTVYSTHKFMFFSSQERTLDFTCN
jgi:hypothetical protein